MIAESDIRPSLFDLSPLVAPQYPRRATIQERFDAFHAANPNVYQALRTLAYGLLKRGVKHYGMKGLYERLRWEYAIQTGGEPYKLSNDFTSRYARLLMDNEPLLRGMFDLRELRSGEDA